MYTLREVYDTFCWICREEKFGSQLCTKCCKSNTLQILHFPLINGKVICMEQEVQDVPYSKPVPLWIGSQACRRHRCHGHEHSCPGPRRLYCFRVTHGHALWNVLTCNVEIDYQVPMNDCLPWSKWESARIKLSARGRRVLTFLRALAPNQAEKGPCLGGTTLIPSDMSVGSILLVM